MAKNPPKPKDMRSPEDGNRQPSRRIETQIHRRRKAKAVFPLQSEWEIGAGSASELRMPSNKMRKGDREDPAS